MRDRAIRPCLLAFTVLFVLFPGTDVNGAVHVGVGAESFGFVLRPLPVVNVAVGVDQAAAAARLVVPPVPLVERSVGPDLLALALTRRPQPLAYVDRPVGELGGQTPLEEPVFRSRLVIEGTQPFNYRLGFC